MITDENIRVAYKTLYNKSVLKKEVRSYEVSIWTLQDEFITVLKWSDVEHKGRIEHPKMELVDDGTQTLSFSIPMYYDTGTGILSENPLWYNTRNGNLMINLRKIKVIFNKGQSPDEHIFEFIITKINERHEGDILTCEVNCEGLAFHELGKIGYKYSLSLDDFELDYKLWQESLNKSRLNEPHQTIDYWCNEKLKMPKWPSAEELVNTHINPKKWYYEVSMDWSSFINNSTLARNPHKMYEEMYTSVWGKRTEDEKEVLYPEKVEAMREKERSINVSESNIYNITQEIAKLFGVFCRYEYGYDANYHIIYRKIIFFNNFIHDKDIMSFTYPYSSKSNARELDGTDIVTKMYVRSVDDSSTLLGEAGITYCTANKMREDYLFNFDYLKETGGITQELYDEISKYEIQMYDINSQLVPLADTIAAYEREKVDLEAKLTTYNNSLALDKELIDTNSALSLELQASYGNGDNILEVYTVNNPATGFIIQDKNGLYCIKLDSLKKGIKADTVKLYRVWGYKVVNGRTTSERELKKRITGITFLYDEYGNPTAIYGVSPTVEEGSKVYMVYSYEPHLYYDSIVQTWLAKLYQDLTAADAIKLLLEGLEAIEGELEEIKGLYTLLEEANALQTTLINQKEEIILKFNEMMGPALREGYWQPEDYLDYGEPHSGELEITLQQEADYDFAAENTYDGFKAAWDNRLFPDENDIYYKEGILLDKVYYPCINILPVYDKFIQMLQSGKQLSVVFENVCHAEVIDLTEWENNRNNIDYLSAREDIYVSTGVGIEHWIYNLASGVVREDVLIGTASEAPEYFDFTTMRSFTIGSEAFIAFVRWQPELANEDDLSRFFDKPEEAEETVDFSQIVPVIVLSGAKSLSEKELDHMLKISKMYIGCLLMNDNNKMSFNDEIGYIGLPTGQLNVGSYNLGMFWRINKFYQKDEYVESAEPFTSKWHIKSENNPLEIVYPRIKFSSLMLKTTSGLYITYNNILLEEFKDYYILNRTVPERNYLPEYLITIKPEVILKYSNSIANLGTFEVDYTLSNASTAIYLDALEIAKENAYPKVTYTVTPNILNESIISTLYNKLNWLVMINDVLLKFKDVFGYISKLTLDLDAPQNDSIEVKNYKNKFEDIFSTIVASTEQMLRNELILGSLMRGTYALSPNGLISTLTLNNSIMTNYFSNSLLLSDMMSEYMENIFSEAADILGASSNALNSMASLSTQNSGILSNFASTIASTLVPSIYRLALTPLDFKQGDIWIEVDEMGEEIGRYVATANSNDSKPGYGWTKTYGGSYALIQGPGINMDADKGILNLYGQDIDIVGNNSVNIGGVEVNITSLSKMVDGNLLNYGGINLIADSYDENSLLTSMSKVLIHPDTINMVGSSIDIATGDINEDHLLQSVSAISLNPTQGIWVGSSKSIILSSANGTDGAANVQLTPGELIFGVNYLTEGTAFKISRNGLTIASGTESISDIETDGLKGVKTVDENLNITSITGLRLTKEFFGVALIKYQTNEDDVLNAVIINEQGITLGANVMGVNSLGQEDLSQATGSYVRVSGSGITMNSNAELSINTNNITIDSLATGTNSIFELKKVTNNVTDTVLKYSLTDGLVVNKGTVGGWTLSNLHIGNAATRNASTIGIVNTNSGRVFWAGGAYNGTGANAPDFSVTAAGVLTANNAIISGLLTAGANSVIGNWSIGTNSLHSGSGSTYVEINSDPSNSYAIWAGSSSAASAPFSVTKSGLLTATNIRVKNLNGTYTTLENYPFWKLWSYHMIKSYTEDSITIDTGSGEATINFNLAGAVTVDSITAPAAPTGIEVTSTTVTATASNEATNTATLSLAKGTPSASGGYASVSLGNTVVGRISIGNWWDAGKNSVKVSTISAVVQSSSESSTITATASNGETKTRVVALANGSFSGGGVNALIKLDSSNGSIIAQKWIALPDSATWNHNKFLGTWFVSCTIGGKEYSTSFSDS